MRNYLLPNTGKYFKANLHCHSTFSDGKYTPERLKELYKAHGYSIIAYTDHEMIFKHRELADESFLPITSYEASFTEESNGRNFDFLKCYHLNLYAKNEDNDKIIFTNLDKIKKWNKVGGRDEDYMPPYNGDFTKSEYSQDFINCFIKEARKNGFLVCLNHPAWSLQTYHDYDRLEGLTALEIVNYSCHVAGYLEDSTHIYDRMLRGGCRNLYPVCSDDNHDGRSEDDPKFDSCGGFTMINAEHLEYGEIMSSFEKGDFYSSTGPLFEEVYYEDGKVHVKCTPVREIRLLNEGRDAPIVIAPKGELITEAVLDVDPAFDGRYIRVDIRDGKGCFADTRAYFLDEPYFKA